MLKKISKILITSAFFLSGYTSAMENNKADLTVSSDVEKVCIFYYDPLYEIGIVFTPPTNTTFNLDETVNIPFGYKCTKGTSFTFTMINEVWQEPIIKVTGIKMSSPGSTDFMSGIIKDLDADLNIHHKLYPKTYTSDGEKKTFNWNFRVENPMRTSGKMPKAGIYSGTARFEISY